MYVLTLKHQKCQDLDFFLKQVLKNNFVVLQFWIDINTIDLTFVVFFILTTVISLQFYWFIFRIQKSNLSVIEDCGDDGEKKAGLVLLRILQVRKHIYNLRVIRKIKVVEIVDRPIGMRVTLYDHIKSYPHSYWASQPTKNQACDNYRYWCKHICR